MSADSQPSSRRHAATISLVVILAAAAIARLWQLRAGVPYAVGIDEPQVVDRAVRILHTGEWNTHAFDYPTLVIYLQTFVAIVRFLWGALNGEWSALDGFSVTAIYGAARFVTVMIAVATVWVTYRLGVALADRRVGLLAAAQLAVAPMHVRESHFALTDVPVTALTTAAVWLAVRAARLRTVRAYAWAGAVCGLAAAAKYTGGVALAAVVAAWIVEERASADRWRKAAACILAAGGAFLLAAPYTVLDLPGFLDGFAAQFSRFAGAAAGPDPIWLVYVKHLSIASPISVPLTAAAILALLWRKTTRTRWMPAIAFTLVYFYVIASRSHAFGRYALPLVPMICLFAAVAIFEAIALLRRIPALDRPRVSWALVAAGVLLLTWGPAAASVGWLDQQKRPDTRALAVDWLEKNAPRNARIAVENSGPTYIDRAGFRAVPSEVLVDHPADWYRENADYLLISGSDLTRYTDYLALGPAVYQIAPTPQRWGPPITVVKVQTPNAQRPTPQGATN